MNSVWFRVVDGTSYSTQSDYLTGYYNSPPTEPHSY